MEQLYEKYTKDTDAFESALLNDLKIKEDLMDRELLFQAERYLKWARLSAIAESRFKAGKRKLDEEQWSVCRDRARKELVRTNQKTTIADVEAQAYKDPLWIEQRNAVLQLEKEHLIFKKAEQAFWQRKEMLMSLNYRQRAEFSMIPSRAE
jgi:hypothetical protein